MRQQAPAVTVVAVTSKTHRSSARCNRSGRNWAPFQNSCNSEPLLQPALEHTGLRYNARWNTPVSVTVRVGTHRSPLQHALEHTGLRYSARWNTPVSVPTPGATMARRYTNFGTAPNFAPIRFNARWNTQLRRTLIRYNARWNAQLRRHSLRCDAPQPMSQPSW